MEVRHTPARRICAVMALVALLTACGGTPPAEEAAATPVVPTAVAEPTTAATATVAPTATVGATPTVAPTATVAPTVAPAIELGDEQRSEAGGYSVQPPLNWETTAFGPVTVIRPKGVTDENAPTFVLEGGVGEGLILTDTVGVQTSDDLLDKILVGLGSDDGREASLTDREDITIDGVAGRAATIRFVNQDVQLEGRAVALFIGAEQRFVSVGAAREAEWAGVASTFADVVATISFFEPEAEPTPTPEPAPTPPPPGGSRATPLPLGSALRFTTWAVTVTDVLRGDEAGQIIAGENQFNDPAPEGFEYVLATVQVENISTEQKSEEVSAGVYFRATGSSGVAYNVAGVSLPQRLEGELFPGGSVEGQVALAVPVDQTNLMLHVEEGTVFEDEAQYFVALDQGAAVTPPDELATLEQSTDDGAQRDSPVKVGDTIRTAGWEATVVEWKRGAEAADFVQAMSEFNDPPSEDNEYVVVRMRVRSIAPDKPDHFSAADNSFLKIVGAQNEVYDSEFISGDARLNALVFPGGEAEGWVAFEVQQDEPDLIVIFQPFVSFEEDDRRFIALAE